MESPLDTKPKPSVLVSVPTGDGWVHKHVCFALLNLLKDDRVNARIILPTHTPYVNNLHHIQKDFLAGEYDYWVNIDADNPPKNNPFDLVFLGLDIVGLPTPVWHNSVKGDFPMYLNAVLWDEEAQGFRPNKNPGGLVEVDAVGTGCIVIARRVMEAMKAPFMRIWDDDGIVHMGGDYAFCRRAKEKGFRIWTHYDYPCFHFNEIELGEIAQAFSDVKKE